MHTAIKIYNADGSIKFTENRTIKKADDGDYFIDQATSFPPPPAFYHKYEVYENYLLILFPKDDNNLPTEWVEGYPMFREK